MSTSEDITMAIDNLKNSFRYEAFPLWAKVFAWTIGIAFGGFTLKSMLKAMGIDLLKTICNTLKKKGKMK